MKLRGVTSLIAIGLAGIVLAAGLGLASTVIARDSVGLPATNLKPAKPLAPQTARTKRVPPQQQTETTRTIPVATTTVDDHGGRTKNGSSPGGSGHGSGSDD